MKKWLPKSVSCLFFFSKPHKSKKKEKISANSLHRFRNMSKDTNG